MDVCAFSYGRLHTKLRFPALRAMGRKFCPAICPDVHGVSRPKTFSLGSFSLPEGFANRNEDAAGTSTTDVISIGPNRVECSNEGCGPTRQEETDPYS